MYRILTRSFTTHTRLLQSNTMANPQKLCMIPGPVEVHEDVLAAMATPATSHVSPVFINIFGEALENLRRVFLTKDAQPFIVSGSGTLTWDMTAVNLIQPNEKVLVLNTGLFGDRIGECMETYGAKVTHLRAPIGDRPSLEEIEKTLKSQGPFRMLTVTHVDTSTGVLSDIEAISKLVRRVSPDTLIAVDGVCSVAAEPIRMDDWHIDVVMTASQKALGTPPGLAIVLASQRAMKVYETRTAPIASYYASWKRWLPIMHAYEARKGAYFGTPAVQLIMALNVSLKQILARNMETVFEQHKRVSEHVKKTVQGWGLKLVPYSVEKAAHSMTAVYYPEGIVAADFLGKIGAHGVVLAGGLHPEIATKYFRIGHMGVSVCEPERKHIDTTLKAIESALRESGYQFK
jgi:alanine-glyoxylate transaminase/serine-glyoxylate transaminase/serine-pyruvate transaminase